MSKHQRQLDIFKPIEEPILIVGAGGIGSSTAFILSKMGCSNITVIDFDEVELHNVNSQFYGEADLGRPKVLALADNVYTMTGERLKTVNEKITKDSVIDDYEIIIMALDSISARKEVFKAIENSFEFLIDARMGGEIIDIYNFTKFNKEFYLESLPAPEETAPQACTGKAIAFNTLAIGSFIGSSIAKISKEKILNQNINFDFKTLELTTY